MSRVSDRVSSAFAAVRREDFLTEDQRPYVDDDRPLPIGYEQTNSQPTTVRGMLELLDVQEGDAVLDVGSGSGWTTALLGHLTGPTGRVHGLELVEELADWGSDNVKTYGMDWVGVDRADPQVLGLPAEAPYDRILVSAEARRLPDALVDQLAPGGRMVIPVWGRLSVVERSDQGHVDVRRVGHYAFVPLR